MRQSTSPIRSWLMRSPTAHFTAYTAITAFSLYTCVYGFRKAFSIATFDGLEYWGIGYKTWLVTLQVAGYAVSKFIGIKVVSEMTNGKRANTILLLMSIAWLSWLLFALVPPPYNIAFLFLNGLPLGMIWGIIFGYLEGRQTSDLLGAGLSVSFIFSSGFSKTVGATLLTTVGTSEMWMPFVAGCLFFVPLLLLVWLINQVPEPTLKDQRARTQRLPMNAASRKAFLLSFAPGLVVLIIAYLLLTAFRDFRDNFTAEIWGGLGYTQSPQLYTSTEIPIAIVVLVVMGSLILVVNNQLALRINHLIIFTGFLLIGVSTIAFHEKWMGPSSWMIITGLGLYLAYVPFNCIFFDRLMAAFRYAGTVGFVMYLADSFGYLGSVGVLFYKEFGHRSLSWLTFYQNTAIVTSVIGAIMILISWFYFERKLNTAHS